MGTKSELPVECSTCSMPDGDTVGCKRFLDGKFVEKGEMSDYKLSK